MRELNNQITEVTNYVGHCRASYLQEQKKLGGLRQKRVKLEALVRHFENDNEEFLKIGRIVEDIVHSTLSRSKVLLKYALLSLVESMKKDPLNIIHLFITKYIHLRQQQFMEASALRL